MAEKFGSKFENVVLGLVSWLVAREGNEGFYHQQNLPSSNCILIKWPNLQILWRSSSSSSWQKLENAGRFATIFTFKSGKDEGLGVPMKVKPEFFHFLKFSH